jgi:hypothetical protein
MNFVNAFQKIALSLGVFFFGLGFLVYSFSPAKADKVSINEGTGKIMMHQNSFVHNGSYYFQVLVWDTETGKSKFYNMDNGNLVKTDYSLPSSPLY